ncbi:MAG: hypothetical protein ACI9DF_003341 [Verrucomicrobiales bacterium]|jgi:hypothetical protein
MSEPREVQVTIVGGGPAGIVLGYLIAYGNRIFGHYLDGEIECEERLRGMLRYYYREAA